MFVTVFIKLSIILLPLITYRSYPVFLSKEEHFDSWYSLQPGFTYFEKQALHGHFEVDIKDFYFFLLLIVCKLTDIHINNSLAPKKGLIYSFMLVMQQQFTDYAER